MQKLRLALENCYGIKKLEAELDFSNGNAFAIYAPNGVMKSSLAQTFQDLCTGTDSKDRVFASRKSSRKITDEGEQDLSKESIQVVLPYDEVFGHTEKTSTLLVDSKLRQEYEQLHVEIDDAKQQFLRALKEQSGSRKDLEKEISSAFTRSDDEFYVALTRIKDELLEQKDAPFASILYDRVFDDKVIAFLETKDFKTAISEYINRYNELISASKYFKKGVFNYYNGATIAKSLADNGFFDASHSLNLKAETKTEISTVDELEQVIEQEKEGITTDDALKKKFAEIEKQLNRNKDLRDFHAYLLDTPHIVPELANIGKFKEEVWKSYLKEKLDLYKALVKKYQAVEARKKEIEEVATRQQTQWESVIEIFNNRFFVPFKLVAKNRVAVVLGQDAMLSLGFEFKDGAETATVERDELLRVLSTGEKKALYILNVIFEVEARKKSGQETLFVFDDITDSFDYKNKYAIIEYLKDISEEPLFKQIMLTHNFDFFRTVNSRFVGYANCLMCFKMSSGLVLEKAAGIRNVFVNDWKPNFYSDSKKMVASIPFIRNIVEYIKGDKDPNYAKLTSLLHWKNDSESITQAELCTIFAQIFGERAPSRNGNEKVIALIKQAADDCLVAGEGINFENKVVLAISIRLAAEKYMVARIADNAFMSTIDANQTVKLFNRFRKKFASEVDAIDVLQRVVLMTPESLHLNSFMYEPILDMSDEHLRRLLNDVRALEKNATGESQ